MNSEEFRRRGYEMIDFVANYMDTVGSREPMPKCVPGYMRRLVPEKAPEKPESWDLIMKDIEPVIMSGMTHWQHPHFHAYFPAGNSWPSILGDVLSNALACSATSWESCPAATELEIIVLDWCAKFLGLPDFFYSKFSNEHSKGGGCIQTSASECVFISLIAARESKIQKLRKKFPDKSKAELKSLLIAYGAGDSHSCFDKACLMAHVKYRLLPAQQSSNRGVVTGEILTGAIEQDMKKGLVPFFYNAVLGSTSTCVFDDLVSIGPTTAEHGMWLHADAAYAGGSFCCPELEYLTEGLEYLSSLNTNANKWLLTCFDCSLHWFKDIHVATDCLRGQNNGTDERTNSIIDFQYWGIPMTRRFRALKLWFTIRSYGVKGLRNYIRHHIRMVKTFELCVRRDHRFEVVGDSRVGLCCFRLKGGDNLQTDSINATLIEALNSTHKIHMVPSFFQNKYLIRFAVCSEFITESDIDYAWSLISDYAEVIIRIQELEKKGGKKFKNILDATHNWKTMCPRPMNRQVVMQIKEYRQQKSSGTKDFIVESISQGTFSSTADLKFVSDAMFDLPNAPLDAKIFSIIEKESTEPTKIIIDSRGKKLKILPDCFQIKKKENSMAES